MKFTAGFHTAAENHSLSITISNHAPLHQKPGTLIFASAQTLQNPEQFVGTQAGQLGIVPGFSLYRCQKA